MKAAAVIVSVFLFPAAAFGQTQTSEQKFFMERAKKMVLDPKMNAEKLGEPIGYLIRRKAGIPFIEQRIIDTRPKNKEEFSQFGVWDALIKIYLARIAVEDIPDRMIPEIVFLAETDADIRLSMPYLAEFGARGTPFLKCLENVRDTSSNEARVKQAIDTIAKIKAN